MRNLELLSPAGSLEIFKSVIDCGADAVYFGGDLFSARAYAANFSRDDAVEALEYAHIRGKKAYITINTLLKNNEINRDLYDFVKFYYKEGVDGVIIQDFGVFNFIKRYFPDLPLHASTQMTLNSSYGASFLKNAGASRIVLSRELSLQEISQIHNDVDIEIEAFVHGALCMSYSGDCLMSSVIGGRSGNRGRCAQPCRLNYKVLNGENIINTKGEYQLSLKDLCGLYALKDMANAGVVSFKIEGRMKSVEYASNVSSIYRKYLDMLNSGQDYVVDDKDYEFLLNAGNRCGFTDSYFYKHNDPDMLTYISPSHEKIEANAAKSHSLKLKIDGSFYAHIGEPFSLKISFDDFEKTYFGSVVEKSEKRPVTITDISEKLKKTGNTPFDFNSLDFDLEDNIFIPIKEINEIRRTALDDLLKSVTFKRSVDDLPQFDNMFKNAEIIPSNNDTRFFVSVCEKDQLFEALKFDFVSNIVISYELLDEISFDSNINYYLNMPQIFRQNASDYFAEYIDLLSKFKGIFVYSYDELGYLIKIGIPKNKIILGHSVYTYSDYAVLSFDNYGYNLNVVPYELNRKELQHRNNNDSIISIYGYYPLMVFANCINKNNIGCDKKPKKLYLRDRKSNDFIVKNHCTLCYNLLYNISPTFLFKEKESLDKLGVAGYLIDFTVESKDKVDEILNMYKSVFIDGEDIDVDFPYTTGHFKRGVL